MCNVKLQLELFKNKKKGKSIYSLILRWEISNYKRLWLQVTNIQRTTMNERRSYKRTENKQMLKLYHARGVFQSSVSWVTMDGAPESCGNNWVNRVRLASDRASTDCRRRPSPVFCCKRKRSEHPSMLPLRLSSLPPPPSCRRAHISPSKRQMAK